MGRCGFAQQRRRGTIRSMSTPNPLKRFVRDVPDFPKPGILFRDITPLLADPEALRTAVRQLADHFRGERLDAILAAEARGFIFAAPVALELNVGFVPIRKPGKLPYQTHTHRYDLEYGSDTLQMHVDAIEPGDRVAIIDDLLATGGTMKACVTMVEQAEATIVGCGFVIELDFLKGRERLAPLPVHSLLHYGGEE